MKRKVIKQGHNTLTITLPSKWVKNNCINAGQEINIEEKGTSLYLTPSIITQKEKTNLDISEFDVALEKVIYSIYKKGYDEIELYSSNPKLLNDVQRIILKLAIGLEIVSHSKNSCIVKSLVEINASEFDPIMRRTFVLLHSMEEGILNSMINKDIQSLRTFRDMEGMNNRYTGFCRRLLNKYGYADQKNEKLVYCLIEFLEKIHDEYKFLCDFFIENDKELEKITKENIQIFKRVSLLSRAIEKLYYKFEIKDYLQIYRERKDILKDINCLYPKQKSPNSILLHYLITVTQFYIDIANFILTMRV